MIINHNLSSMSALHALNSNNTSLQNAIEHLSSGKRINGAADDAAGLAISEKMKSQIDGLDQASRNSQDGISLIQTAEGALNETHSILQRMRDLAVQSANDSNTSADRTNIQAEVDQLAQEITRISNTTEFNTQNLLAGGLNDTFQIGSNQGQNINLTIGAMDAKSLGVSRDLNYTNGFAAGGTGLASTSVGDADLGSGLTAQTYNLVVTHTAASTTLSGATTTGAATAGGTYTGNVDQTVQFRVDAVSGTNEVTAASYSTDAGKTWTAASVDSSGANGIISYQGATVTIASAAGNAAGQTVNAAFTAKSDTIQLQDSTATNIGSAVTVHSGDTSATVGDASTGRTVQINSSSFGSLTAGTATVTVATQAASAATVGSGNVVTQQAVAKAGIDVRTQATANSAITIIDKAIGSVSAERAQLGAYQNRLEHTINNLGTASQNLTSASSRITDVDMAQAMSEFTKDNVLQQAAVSMLAQANQQPQMVLKLLG